jgi:hypothetical protein
MVILGHKYVHIKPQAWKGESLLKGHVYISQKKSSHGHTMTRQTAFVMHLQTQSLLRKST